MTDTPQDARLNAGPESSDGFVRGLGREDNYGELLDGLNGNELRDLIVDALVTISIQEGTTAVETAEGMYGAVKMIQDAREFYATLEAEGVEVFTVDLNDPESVDQLGSMLGFGGSGEFGLLELGELGEGDPAAEAGDEQ